MPSLPHEGLIELIRQRPTVVADLLAGPLKSASPRSRKLGSSQATSRRQSGPRGSRREGRRPAHHSRARGVTVPDEARERITGCRDIEKLDAWIVRAVTADRIDDLFG